MDTHIKLKKIEKIVTNIMMKRHGKTSSPSRRVDAPCVFIRAYTSHFRS
jgi:hypothetical protein